MYAQWSSVPSDSSVLMFELEGSAMGWVAMGLSADQVMGGNGIDDVFVCQRNTGNNNVFAKDTFNPQSPRSNNIDSVSLMLIGSPANIYGFGIYSYIQVCYLAV